MARDPDREPGAPGTSRRIAASLRSPRCDALRMRAPANARQAAQLAKVMGRAFASNALNAISKDLHASIRRATGRGQDATTPEEIARYQRETFERYLAALGVERRDWPAFLAGKAALEYGPGDLPGAALLLVAHGAERVTCVDRFPLLRMSEANREGVRILAETLEPAQRARLQDCFTGPGLEGGLRPERIRHVIDDDGLSGLRSEADLALSCAVLEHVNDLPGTLADMAAALRPGGLACHFVDLRSHGFDWGHPLDFLGVPAWAWRLVSSHNGSLSNRLRLSDHRRALAALPLADVRIEATEAIPEALAESARPWLAREFRDRSPEDLSILGFRLTCRRA